STGDSWLQSNLDGYIQWAKTHNSLFILVSDEDDDNHSNNIPAVFVGQMVNAGDYNTNINHLDILKTIEDMYGLSYAGSSNNSNDITDCWTTSTAIDNSNSAPLSFRLYQNYPNPFNPSTTIKYSLPKEGVVTLKVYNVLGKEVKTLVNEFENAGAYNVSFNASDLPSGIYFYRFISGNFTQVKKLVLLK
ncbi:MAG: T9SS type A sorting domain-containing protein, partial [Ignavibacteriaceae bacterium]